MKIQFSDDNREARVQIQENGHPGIVVVFRFVGGMWEFDELDSPQTPGNFYHMSRLELHHLLGDIHGAGKKLSDETNNTVKVRLPNTTDSNSKNPYREK